MKHTLAAIRLAIHRATCREVSSAPEAVGGGCIHQTLRLGSFFVKLNRPDYASMFESEAEGLRAIAATHTLRVPEAITSGSDAQASFLVLEWLDLCGVGDESRLGEQLAALHQCTGDACGWPCDNFIGSTPQPNAPCGTWAEFFRDRRLGHMLNLLARRGIHIPGADRLLERLPELLAGCDVRASLLHGDLWGGNAGFLRDGTPVIFDPAVYRGHHETDLAMTTLFGGFGPRFYAGYHAVMPPRQGHEIRREVYNLYHILNHALLFGGGYSAQAATIVRRLMQSKAPFA